MSKGYQCRVSGRTGDVAWTLFTDHPDDVPAIVLRHGEDAGRVRVEQRVDGAFRDLRVRKFAEESRGEAMSVFTEVANNPRVGDILRFAGGRLAYEVIKLHGQEDGPPKDHLDVGRRSAEDPKDGAGSPIGLALTIETTVWKDLVRFACTVERAP